MSLDDDRRYFTVEWSQHRTGGNMVLLHLHGEGRVLEADDATGHLLRLCRGAKTLADHARHVSSVTGQSELRIRSAIGMLVDASLLRATPTGDVPRKAAGAVLPTPKKIRTAVVLTADRPTTLARGLASALAHCRRHSRDAQFVVLDGSTTGANRTETEVVTSECGHAAGVTYVDAQKTGRLSADFATTQDAEIALWGIASGTTGSNRNLALLATAGAPTLMVDDDITWIPWRADANSARVALGAHGDPRRATFFSTRSEAIAVDEEDVDILAAHEDLLGRRISDLASRALCTDNACGHLLRALYGDHAMTVRITMAGIAGDAGTYCPYRWLLSEGQTTKDLMVSPALFQLATTSRETRRCATQPVVTHEPHCMAGCMAVGNDAMLPPFLPYGRNAEGVFGALLAAIEPEAAFGHVPYGLIHDSERRSLREPGPIVSATETRLSDAMVILIQRAAVSMPMATARERLEYIASVLIHLGRAVTPAFRAHMIDVVAEHRVREVSRLEEIAAMKDAPLHWRRAAANYCAQFRSVVASPTIFCPVEMVVAGNPEASWQNAKDCIERFGRFLMVWPELWTRAVERGSQHLYRRN